MSNGFRRVSAEDLVPVGERFVNLAIEKLDTPPAPTNPEDGPEYLRSIGCTVPDHFERIHFHRSSVQELHFMIPPKKLIQQVLDDIETNPNSVYPLRDEYTRIVNRSTDLSLLEIFYFRVGDYSLGHCR